MLKSLAAIAALALLSSSAFAANSLSCADQAVKTAVMKNYKRFGASTSSCGTKLLTSGDYLETYLVCVTDETDPSEWVVVMDSACKAAYAEVQYDSQTPNFEDGKGLLKTIGCSISDGDDAQLECQ